MINYPKISIVTPSFNQGQYLEQTIQSVLGQKYPNLEYIIIDGGSTDNSVSIIKKYEKYLSYWVSEKDGGQSEAINKGIAKCTGEIFNWLNSDDFYSSGILNEVAKTFGEGADVATGRTRYHFPDGRRQFTGLFPPSQNLVRVLFSRVYVQQSTFYKTQFIKEVKGVNTKLHYAMDYELWLKYLLMNGLAGVKINKNIIADFRIHETSKTSLSDNDFFKEWLKIYLSIRSYLHPEEVERFKQITDDYRFDIAKIKIKIEVVKEALSEFFYIASVDIYGQRDFQLFDLFASLIDPKHLNQKNRSELKRMKFRRKIIPGWMYGAKRKQ